MMRALVINCSEPHYNLGARKLADWLRSEGHTVEEWAGDPGMFAYGYDLVCLSVIFSWHAPIARDIAQRVSAHSDVWAGGPGLFALWKWWKDETGLTVQRGIDTRFDKQRGNYKMTFASRGCPVNCSFCIVPRLEGIEFTLDWDFQPAPVLCDNNLSALPADFQEHIIRRYQETSTRLGDANSGFEPRTFTEETYQRWKPILRGPWRFAFDEMSEEQWVRPMMDILKSESSKRKRVYVLIGNEPIAACYERAMKVIEWGGEPWCQYVLPLNWLGNPAAIRSRFDWTYRLGRDFARFFNRHYYKYTTIQQYQAGQRTPFAAFRAA